MTVEKVITYKSLANAIVRVSRVKKNLHFFTIDSQKIPYKIIMRDNLVSCTIHRFPSYDRYNIHVRYSNNHCETIEFPYRLNDVSWEEETQKVVEKTIRLL